jgi:uncharacterized membrane protein
MSLAHVHLLLNHFPIVGSIIGLGLFILALVAKSDHLKQTSLVVLLGIAMLAFPTYLSGNAAAEEIQGLPGVSMKLIEAHQNSALLAFLFMEITGSFAWLGLWQFRRLAYVPRWNLTLVLVLSVLTVLLMSTVGNTGGDIRHPEIANDMPVGPSIAFNSVAIGLFVTRVPWMWPTCETLHFIGLSLLFGILFFLNLRMLGIMKNVSFNALHRLLPWGILGFGINLLTGMLFFVGAPTQYTKNGAFHWKILLILLAGVNALYFTMVDETWALKAGQDAPLKAKAVALSAIFLWVGVMYCGSMLPFLGNAF